MNADQRGPAAGDRIRVPYLLMAKIDKVEGVLSIAWHARQKKRRQLLLMKRYIAPLALLSLISTGAASAQTPEQPAPSKTAPLHHTADPQQQVNHLTKKLALTADQQGQILPILTDRQQQVQSIMNDTSLNNKQRHARLFAVRNDAESKIRNILTDTQRASYDQMQQEARERARTRKQTTVQ